MTNSGQSQDPRRPSNEVDRPLSDHASNGHHPAPAPDGATATPVPDQGELHSWLEAERQIQELEAGEANVRLMNAAADVAEAEAEEAWSRADAEPGHQKMSLWERGVKYALLTLLTLAAIALAIGLSIASPWLLSVSVLLATIAAVKEFKGKEEEQTPQGEEKKGDP